MKNLKTADVVTYMIRHFLTFNVTDPLSNASRGYANYTQLFSGDGTASQVNYLERKPSSGGRFIVKLDGTAKTDGVDFDLDSSAGTITWSGSTPSDDDDNIEVIYQTVKQWIYDDHPYQNSGTFPRITVDSVAFDYETPGMGIYSSYNSKMGDLVTFRGKVIVRNRKLTEDYTYSSIKYKNMDLVNAISEQIINYFETNRQVIPWKFYDWKIVRSERIRSEEDMGIFRKDITIEARYYDQS